MFFNNIYTSIDVERLFKIDGYIDIQKLIILIRS